jgi:hypothetical protein
MVDDTKEWVLYYQTVDGRDRSSSYLSQDLAMLQAQSLERQKASLKKLVGPGMTIDGPALRILVQQLR